MEDPAKRKLELFLQGAINRGLSMLFSGVQEKIWNLFDVDR